MTLVRGLREAYEVQLRIALFLGGFNERFELSPAIL
jgi:hypothetical protein